MMQSPQMQQLRQRVIASYHLGPLDKGETQAYIEHRLTHVGWKGDPQLRARGLELIHTASGGIPRRINTLCNRLLLAGFLGEKHAFGVADVQAIAREISEELGPEATLVHGWRPRQRSRLDVDARRLRQPSIPAPWLAHFRRHRGASRTSGKDRRQCDSTVAETARPRAGQQTADADRPVMGEILRPMGPLICVVGARPNYMKMAPLMRAFASTRRTCPGVVLVHTGQHYDVAMNERLFADLRAARSRTSISKSVPARMPSRPPK